MDGGAWWAAVHGVAKSRTQLRDFTFTFHFHASVKEMATHSSVLAWRIPGTGKPGGRLTRLSSSSRDSDVIGLKHLNKGCLKGPQVCFFFFFFEGRGWAGKSNV